MCKLFAGGPSYDLQCNNLSQTYSSVFFRLKTVRKVEHTWERSAGLAFRSTVNMMISHGTTVFED